MSTFLLIRHASNDWLGKGLAGRADGIALNDAGRCEAERLAARLTERAIHAIYASPQARARDTAAPLAHRLRLTVQVEAGLDEIDFGAWTGRSFAALAKEAAWRTWVERRSAAQPPGGETIAAVQQRIVGTITRLRDAHPDETLALVTHGDVIKAALAHFLNLSLDDLERFDIAPASVSAVAMGPGWAQVKLVNG